MLILSDASTCRHIPLHSISLFWSVCAMRLAHCNLLWMRFKFFYLFACFVNLFKTTLWFLRPFEPLLFILALSLSVMILFLQQHKSPKEIQENETVAHLALNAFCCGWQLCQTSFVYHMYVLLYHMICILYVCVCVGIHICKIHTSLSSIFAVINCKWCKSYSLSLVPLVHVWVVPRAPQLSLPISQLSRLPQGLHTASTHAHTCKYVCVHICM